MTCDRCTDRATVLLADVGLCGPCAAVEYDWVLVLFRADLRGIVHAGWRGKWRWRIAQLREQALAVAPPLPGPVLAVEVERGSARGKSVARLWFHRALDADGNPVGDGKSLDTMASVP